MKTPEELIKQFDIDNTELQCDNDCSNCSKVNVECTMCIVRKSYLAGVKEATRWRSVEEELPKETEIPYLVKTTKDVGIARFSCGSFVFQTCRGTITHWRPIYN